MLRGNGNLGNLWPNIQGKFEKTVNKVIEARVPRLIELKRRIVLKKDKKLRFLRI